MRAFLLISTLIFLASCKVTEYVTVKEKEYITDSIAYEKTVTDTVFIQREVKESQEIDANTFLPCPKDSTEVGGFGTFKSGDNRSEEHTSELQSRVHLVCRLLLEKKKYYKFIQLL